MRRAALATLLGAAAALGTSVPAFAQGPAPAPAPTPTPTPAPAPKPGNLALSVQSGIASHGRRYVLAGDTVTLAGKVTPYVPGQVLRIRITSPHHHPARARATVGR